MIRVGVFAGYLGRNRCGALWRIECGDMVLPVCRAGFAFGSAAGLHHSPRRGPSGAQGSGKLRTGRLTAGRLRTCSGFSLRCEREKLAADEDQLVHSQEAHTKSKKHFPLALCAKTIWARRTALVKSLRPSSPECETQKQDGEEDRAKTPKQQFVV